MPKSPYEVLGLGEFATKREIRRRYLELCKLHHPDVATHQQVDFREISAAYEQLTKRHRTIQRRGYPSVHSTPFDTQLWTRRSVLAGFGLATAVAIYVSYDTRPKHSYFV